MSDELKVLGQEAPAATTETNLYETPTLVQTTTSTLVICNRGAGAATFRVSVAPGGVATDNAQYLFYDAEIQGNDTVVAVLGLTLAQTDVLRVYASTANLSFGLYGVETIRDAEAT